MTAQDHDSRAKICTDFQMLASESQNTFCKHMEKNAQADIHKQPGPRIPCTFPDTLLLDNDFLLNFQILS